jgi:hypothetical protein
MADATQCCLAFVLQDCVSFSIDELAKLEVLLQALDLPADAASELQAGVMNRLMDVYHKLTLQAATPGVREGQD